MPHFSFQSSSQAPFSFYLHLCWSEVISSTRTELHWCKICMREESGLGLFNFILMTRQIVLLFFPLKKLMLKLPFIFKFPKHICQLMNPDWLPFFIAERQKTCKNVNSVLLTAGKLKSISTACWVMKLEGLQMTNESYGWVEGQHCHFYLTPQIHSLPSRQTTFGYLLRRATLNMPSLFQRASLTVKTKSLLSAIVNLA